MDHHPSNENRLQRQRRLVGRIIRLGWACVALSALFLYLSQTVAPGESTAREMLWAVYLMLARLCGIGSFAIGGIAIFNRRWAEGIALLLLSVVLPAIAFQLHGTV